ncbi:UvrD-helicase domain-containing protein [Leptospira brenneri]|uniref:UvrD-helicase domain-containing protein n=1 Tax=Leptospira brenneri TaxID=2023182 RepID=UPI000C2A12B1|nr:UvrD-helicase domain-containing protein [Leptospira brenneri]PJZ43757.1 AAA family ATPase [Leptospira brenneri]
MIITIKNCNNIDFGSITIDENKLNIKFAPNGTGKSSISNAIVYYANGGKDLEKLTPFKLLETNPDGKKPEVSCNKSINTIMLFDEKYLNQFIFKESEIIENSFDIFIKNDNYKRIEEEIQQLTSEIKDLFSNNPELVNLIATLKELGDAFKLTKSGISKASTGMKSLSGGNKIHHIPEGLESYKSFIQSTNSVSWIDWQIKGNEYSEISDACPFCTSEISDKKEQIQKVSIEYDKNNIKNLLGLIKTIENLGIYFTEEANNGLKKIIELKNGLEQEHENYLINIKNQIDDLIIKLEKLKSFSGHHFNESDNVVTKLPDYKLDLQFFPALDSRKMRESIEPINGSIDSLISKGGLLQGKINIQRREMQSLIQRYMKEINDFLSYAGYRYMVETSGDAENTKLILKHRDHKQSISGGNQHLSFGERNAFSIVLFMYEVLSKNPDLIILDDPISSFDKNKKYAILEMLFRRDSALCLKNKTVLMLTHDIEPIIDTVKSLGSNFNNHTKTAFLKLKDNVIIEFLISKSDIQTFHQICKRIIHSQLNNLIKLIYLRRMFEISDENSDQYQVLSNLFKSRSKDTSIDKREPKDSNGNYSIIKPEIFDSGCEAIKEYLPNFSYSDTINKLSNNTSLLEIYNSCQSGYEKLQIFRLFNIEVENSVIKKFMNETYHIENEFICQLDPSKFDTVPEYVVQECDKMLENI